MSLCIYCFKHEGNKTPYCPDNPGKGCTYGLGHEFPVMEIEKPKQLSRQADKNLCTKCGLHTRNPASASSDCAHEYPTS